MVNNKRSRFSDLGVRPSFGIWRLGIPLFLFAVGVFWLALQHYTAPPERIGVNYNEYPENQSINPNSNAANIDANQQDVGDGRPQIGIGGGPGSVLPTPTPTSNQ